MSTPADRENAIPLGADFVHRLVQALDRLFTLWPQGEQGRPLAGWDAAKAKAIVGQAEFNELEQLLQLLLDQDPPITTEQLLDLLPGDADAKVEGVISLYGRLMWLGALCRGDFSGVEMAAPPVPVTPFTPDTITFINAPQALAALRAMWAVANGQLDTWQRSEYGPPYYADQKSGIHVYMQEGSEFNPQALDVAWQRVLSLDDNKVSTFLICIGKWMADTGGDTKTIVKARVHVADILSFRGVKKHHKGGYRRDQKEDARRDVLALNAIWVRSPETSRDEKGKPGPGALDSRLLEVAIESQQDLSGRLEPYAFRIAPGEWALHYLGPHSRWTAELLRPVMQYDPDKQRLAMRLGIYLASQWRIRAATENYAQPWAVRTLLQGAFIELPTANYDRFRQQVENALDRLHADRVITGWEYVGDTDLSPRKWFDQWLNWRVSINPPQASIERYGEIAPRRRRAISRSKQAASAAKQRQAPT